MQETVLPPSHRHVLRAGAAAVAVAALLILIKAGAYVMSGSASVLASLMDSLTDIMVSVMTFMAIRYSLKPADLDHRHGHGKIEGLAALFQAALIGIAACLLAWESTGKLFHPRPVEAQGVAIAVMVVASILSFLLLRMQKKALAHAASLAVEADQAHYATDIIINVGVIAVLLALAAGAPLWLDPVFGLAVAGYLGTVIYKIGRQGVDMLLDREVGDSVRAAIIAAVKAQPGVRGLHDLRAIRSGIRLLISFDMEVDAELKLRDAHDIARATEKALLARFPEAEILIHLDPHGDTDDSRHGAHTEHH